MGECTGVKPTTHMATCIIGACLLELTRIWVSLYQKVVEELTGRTPVSELHLLLSGSGLGQFR